MKQFLLSLMFVFGLLVTPAMAGVTIKVNCQGLSKTACAAAIKNLKRAPYTGPVRPATEPMACARVVSPKAQPVEWVDSSQVGQWRDGRLITSTGVVHTEPFALEQGWTVTESCIPRRLLRNVSELTLCTGLLAEGFHWKLTDAELRQMKKTGHFTSYVPFLTDSDRKTLSRQQVRAAYRARYGTR